MNDDQLNRLLDDAARNWRVPVDPPLDDIWRSVEDEAFRPVMRRSRPGWSIVGVAAAVALVIGAFGGSYVTRRGIVPPVTNPVTGLNGVRVAMTPANDPNQRAMSELIGSTAVLLASLPADSGAKKLDPQISVEGARLLTTTRMLLDSPLGSDSRLRNLLQDLELVLAQVARLEPRHRNSEMQFIQTALDEHDLVPRLRSAAADLSLNEF
jgi:hypothetical protein